MAEPNTNPPARRTGMRAEGSTEIIGERWQLPNDYVHTIFSALAYDAGSARGNAEAAQHVHESLSKEPFASTSEPCAVIHDPAYGDEIAIRLADGGEIRTATGGDGEKLFSGSYVRVITADGTDNGYWHADEWQADPVGVMGAILASASGIELRRS